MSLFQNSVLNKHLNDANDAEMQAAYQKLIAYFHNPVIQQNIRESKEEQFQEGFLRELFVDVLGYIINPNPDYNLTTEFKNERGARKADGAILRGGAAIAVIELKSTTTKDLESIRLQAFDYKANHSKCVYVVTSNFEKLRFYINNAVDFEEFDLFTLNYEQFRLMWLCLAKTNLLKGIPLAMKEASLVKEEDITKQIYIDYTAFKRDLYNDLIAHNLGLEIFSGKEEKEIKLLLFKRSQKLLDRFLFLFFGEDRGLLPPNSVSDIIGQWENQSDWGDDVRLYSRFKKYFGLLNTGWKGKKYEVFAYNGGLFAPDEVLDNVKISDEMLKRHTQILTAYDFESDVDVNILGHIFENSLSEIEEITAQIEGAEIDLKQSKRKKEGVFYTPKYITKYIVENTVGKLCDEKKLELGILDFDYDRDFKLKTWRTIDFLVEVKVKGETKKVTEKRKTNITVEGTQQLEILNKYRDWLLGLTICDPACGSGAFLNQTLDFLIKEHSFVTEMTQKITGDVSVMFIDIENQILENNIFGVDINEESVEIAKLSLWLRTAQKGRKLTTLSNNIKCGNSLIDDPELGGEKAFNWQMEFPEVFKVKEKLAWHVTTATHNSRYSQRMFDSFVKLGQAVWLSPEEEIIVSETIAEIAKADDLNIMAYNICGDHAHILLVCEENEISKIVGKLKSMSARACNIAMGRTRAGESSGDRGRTRGHAPLSGAADATTTATKPERGEAQAHLWTQKFGCKKITSEEQLQNTIAYIRNNRIKHGLDDNGACSIAPASSLVPTCTREHAFRTEYKGGFDVVIGNPPYVQLQTMGEMSDKLSKCGYQTYNKSADLYCLFYERGCQILKPKGYLSYVTSNKWLRVNYGESLRKFLTTKVNPKILIDFPGIPVFAEAVVDPHILILTNELYQGKTEACILKTNTPDLETVFEANKTTREFSAESWTIVSPDAARKLDKMKLNGTELKDLPISINYGIKTGYNDAFFIDEATRNILIAEDANSAELIKPMVRGRDISPYEISGFEYLICTFPSLNVDIENYPAIKNHLLSFGHYRLKQTGDKGSRKKTSGKWFETQDSINYYKEFAKPKIIYPNMTSVFPFTFDETGLLGNDKSFILTAQDDSVSLLFLTAVLNSSLAKLWIWWNCPELGNNRREIRKVYFEHFPVPKANDEQIQMLAQKASERTQLTSDFQALSSKFIRSIQRKFNIESMTNKLNEWYLLSYGEFIKELSKKKVKLSLSEEAEWEEYFLQESGKTLALKSEIDITDREIDKMVYELYGVKIEQVGDVNGD